MSGSLRRGSWWLLLALCGALTAGSGAAPVLPPVPIIASIPVPGAVVSAAPAASPAAAVRPGAAPARLDVPVLGVHARVVPVVVAAAGELGVPDDPQVIGWWAAGGRPGVAGAALVLDGHVDSAAAGPGALFRLAALVPGDAVGLVTADGAVLDWTVESVRGYPKSALPADVFAATSPTRLVIVTCGGTFDRRTRQYADNIVVTARGGAAAATR
ncbi:class F sortase [Pseudonocardia sp.]|uniref:class F sortase n=1 Tax=Pseudonocardia sp. TaxID=60912 RepID=UPI0026241BB5|nr:class F sortase [Pseudonocardia sp.]MCW2716523.1 peptidase sortase [Pseudonocardia sp.]